MSRHPTVIGVAPLAAGSAPAPTRSQTPTGRYRFVASESASEFVGSPQSIDFTRADGRIERKLMYPVRLRPSVDADMPIVRWVDRDEAVRP